MKTTLKALLISAAFAATVAGSAGFAAPDLLLHIAAGQTSPELKAMEGKRVLGKSRELLGHIGNVNEQAKTVELKTTSGAIVSLSTDVLIEDDDALSAPSLSRGDLFFII